MARNPRFQTMRNHEENLLKIIDQENHVLIHRIMEQ